MNIQDYFKVAREKGAADLHLVGGSKSTLRIGDQLIPVDEKPLDNDELKTAIFSLLDKKQTEHFLKSKELDFGQEIQSQRFRINLHFQEGKIGLTARVIAKEVPAQDKLGFTEILYGLTHLRDGLILVVGTSGSGRSEEHTS